MAKSTTSTKKPAAPKGAAAGVVGSSWFGLIFNRSTVLVGMVTSYVVALRVAFSKFQNFFEASKSDNPWTFWGLLLTPLLFVALFSVGPEAWKRYQAFQRTRLIGSVDANEAAVSGYFRLEAYAPEDPDDFRRPDNAHIATLRWITTTPRHFLFLSGLSGVGKSSIFEGYLEPKLRKAGWQVTIIRGFGDMLVHLEDGLRTGEAAQSKLLVFDQFEEFIINEERQRSSEGDMLIQRVLELKGHPPDRTKFLFVIRSDYLNGLLDLSLDQLISRDNWIDVDPFRRSAASNFLLQSPLRPSQSLVDEILDGIEVVEEARGLYRPVTLNMVGLALSFFELKFVNSPTRLIQDYLRQAITQVGISDISPKIVALLITDAGTKQPMSIHDLASMAKVSMKDVELCLSLMAAKGIVRPLNNVRDLWEISHDFVAKQLSILLHQLRVARWTRMLLWSLPLWFLIALGSFAYIYPTAMKSSALRQLQQADASLSQDNDKNDMVTVAEMDDDPKDVAHIADLARRYGATALDLSETLVGIDDISFLAKFNTLRALRLCKISARNLRPLAGLNQLTMLDLSNSNAGDIYPVGHLTALESLYIPFTKVTDIRPLANLRAKLTELDLEADLGITDFRPLNKLKSLQDLTVNRTHFSNFSVLSQLTQLVRIEAAWTEVSSLDGVEKLSNLKTLIIDGTGELDLSPLVKLRNLAEISINERKLQGLSGLSGSSTSIKSLSFAGSNIVNLNELPVLPELTSLALARTKISDVGPLLRYKKLRYLGLAGTNVPEGSPAVLALKKRGVQVSFGDPGKPGSGSPDPSCHDFDF